MRERTPRFAVLALVAVTALLTAFADAGTLFGIASNTKAFTATALGLLAGHGFQLRLSGFAAETGAIIQISRGIS